MYYDNAEKPFLRESPLNIHHAWLNGLNCITSITFPRDIFRSITVQMKFIQFSNETHSQG